MTIAAKVIASTLIATGISLAGYYLIGVGEVEWHSLTKDSNFSDAYTGKVGEKYGMYLVSPTNSKNKAWWNEIYSKYEKHFSNTANESGALSTHFAKSNENETAKVSSAYSTDVDTALNKVCEEAYKKI